MILLIATVLVANCLTINNAKAANSTQGLGSCQDFTSCCDPAVHASCLGTSGDCYCDVTCYQFNDCCSDISNSCLAASNQPTADTALGSCQDFTSCCDPVVHASCLGTPGDCYCDVTCYQFNDCCSDISNSCLAASNQPTTDTGSCVNQGFSGCCNPNTHVTCKGDDDICFCDQVCFQYGDCCSDIHQIGCYTDGESSATPLPSSSSTPNEGSCTAAGFQSCCNPSDSANCYGNPPTCYCDEVCFQYNDCCSDIGQICTVESPTDSTQGSCSGLGFTSGCCEPTSTQSCHGTDGTCYCDKLCYNYGDCCEDIEEINCFNVQPTGAAEGSCVSQGFEGCCDPSVSVECYGSAGTSCYCDQLCFQFNDCCSDVDQIGCLEPSTLPPQNNGSCLLAGHLSCCSISAFEQCLGSDGSCYCDAACHNYGDCCQDINLLLCTSPTNTANGSCQAAGYTECCHPYHQNGGNCYGNTQTCYCDQLCYQFGDCCSDITSIGCIAPTGEVTPNEGTCAARNFTSCCIPSDTQSCLGYPETCHCDAVCHDYGDCCSDAIDIGCFAQTGSCVATGRTSCCLSDDSTCTGTPANCFCDQGCFGRGDCCSDIGSLQNCHVGEDKVAGPVLNLVAVPVTDTSLNVTWYPPTDTNGANIYLVKLINYTKTGYDLPIMKVISISKTFCVFDDLTPLHPYNVSVFAVNQYGNGESKELVAFTKQGFPNVAPHNIQVIHSNLTMVTVSWTPLNYSEGQGIVTGYFVSLFSLSDCPPSFVTAIIVEGQLTHTVTFANLQHNVKYAAEVAGKTTVGLGVLSDMITGDNNAISNCMSSTHSTRSPHSSPSTMGSTHATSSRAPPSITSSTHTSSLIGTSVTFSTPTTSISIYTTVATSSSRTPGSSPTSMIHSITTQHARSSASASSSRTTRSSRSSSSTLITRSSRTPPTSSSSIARRSSSPSRGGSHSGSTSPVHYGMIIGLVIAIFVLITVIIAAGFVILLVWIKARNKRSEEGIRYTRKAYIPPTSSGYTRLLVNDVDESDDEEMID